MKKKDRYIYYLLMFFFQNIWRYTPEFHNLHSYRCDNINYCNYNCNAFNEANVMHYLSSVYSVTIPLHVSGLLVAHHQEVTMYICNKWYVLYILVDCQLLHMYIVTSWWLATSKPETCRGHYFHLAVCLTTGPKTLPKQAVHILRSRASSFTSEYPLLSLR
jgi:hypothetical protein